jgi:hypothetical protein
VAQNGPGTCDPPDDLNCDGTGTDQHFQSFLTALINHVGPGRIKYWEMWNEPTVAHEWNGAADCPNTPNAQYLMLARMAQDMHSIASVADPNALFTTPAPVGDVAGWLSGYFSNSNGAKFADIVAFHGYLAQSCSGCPIPEDVINLVGNVRSVVSSAGQGSKPLFDTEGSWGAHNGTSSITDPDQQVAFTGRYYLLQIGAGVAKFYWYGWDFPNTGDFFNLNTASLTSAGVAYQQIVTWTSGATVEACVQNSTQWTCTITGSNGSQSEAIWDTSQSCSGGVCSTINVTVGSQFMSYTDLAGNKHPISNAVVPIGAKPILLTIS